jgi:hypothetical protein
MKNKGHQHKHLLVTDKGRKRIVTCCCCTTINETVLEKESFSFFHEEKSLEGFFCSVINPHVGKLQVGIFYTTKQTMNCPSRRRDSM